MKTFAIRSAVIAAIGITPVSALANDAFIGGLVGGMIGGAIANQPKQKKVYRKAAPRKTYSSSKKKTYVDTAQRQANRETQNALNYFGFNAGGADGVLGSRSRAAISGYQAHLGYPATGQLTSFERTFLISAWHRAQAGGPATASAIASNPLGVKGLLIAYRDEQTNGAGATASIGGHYGLPKVVAAAVNEIAKSSDPSAEQLVQRSGFIQLSDINGDGQTDYIIDTSVTGSAFWCNAQSCAVRVFASTPDGYERNDFQAFNVTPAMFSCTRGTCAKTGDSLTTMAAAEIRPNQPPAPQTGPQTQMVAATPVPSAQPVVQAAPVPAAAAAAAIPSFTTKVPAQVSSLTSHCNKVSLMTSTNGGFIEASDVSDPDLALAEQMCLARTYAISHGEDLMAKVQGASRADITRQCEGFTPLLMEHVAAVSLHPRAKVLEGVSSFVQSSGMAPAQLETTARICLSAGYTIDDMDLAMGSALLLVALGEAPYGELVGHHLSQGFGATRRYDMASVWYEDALAALEGGAPAVFAPGQPERVALLRAAATAAAGGGDAAPAPQKAALPAFSVTE